MPLKALLGPWLPSRDNVDPHTLSVLELSVSEITAKQAWAESSEIEARISSALGRGSRVLCHHGRDADATPSISIYVPPSAP